MAAIPETPKPAPAHSGWGTPAINVPKPLSLADVLRGPSLTPGDAPAVTGNDPAATKPPPASTPGASSAAPAAPQEIDLAAAKMGKRVALKIRAGIMNGALRFYGIDPKDPEIQDLLPKDMRSETRGSEQSILEMVLDENPEKTQKLGKLFRGWLGMLTGTIFEAFDATGTVRQIAMVKGIELPEERILREVQERKRQTEQKPEAPRNPEQPAPKVESFDINQALMNARRANGA